MKKYAFFVFLIFMAATILAGCARNALEPENGKGAGEDAPVLVSQAADQDVISPRDSQTGVWDKIPMVMVDGRLYYDTGKESVVTKRCNMMDGEITSTVDGSETPAEDDQSNFGTGFSYQYGEEDSIEVFMNGKWIIFEQRKGGGSQVRFGDRMVDADALSAETMDWLAWYNGLSKEEQLQVSAVPADLLAASGIDKIEDAPAAVD